MINSKLILRLLSDIQILSALIWASTILACAYVSDKNYVFLILVTAAGFHSTLMSRFAKSDKCVKGQ